MSDALKPAKHGRDHCPGGIDEIPCLTSDMPWARMSKSYSSTVQTIPSGTNTDIVFDTFYNIAAGESGNGYFADNDPSNQDLTVVQKGIYLAKGFLIWTGTNVGPFRFAVNPNAASFIDWQYADTNHLASGDQVGVVTSLLHLKAAMGLTITVYHEAGADRFIDAAYLHVVKLTSYTGNDWDLFNPDQP